MSRLDSYGKESFLMPASGKGDCAGRILLIETLTAAGMFYAEEQIFVATNGIRNNHS